MRFIWLASYPKCGNTWTRFLLYQYFHGEVQTSADIAREIPDIHYAQEVQPAIARATRQGRDLLCKTHNIWSARMPGKRYIYIIRHPRDVLVSVMNFHRLMSPTRPFGAMTEHQYVLAYLEKRRNPLNYDCVEGPFDDHWKSWLNQKTTPGIVVRYDDLRDDALGQLRRMVECLGAPFDEERARRAVELSTFERMRALEVKEKTAGVEGTVFHGAKNKVRDGLLFMNKGKSGRTLDGIAPGLDAACDARFQETLERFRWA